MDMDMETLIAYQAKIAAVQNKTDDKCTPEELAFKQKLAEAEENKNKRTQDKARAEAEKLAAELEKEKARLMELAEEEEVQTLVGLKSDLTAKNSEMREFIKGSETATKLIELEGERNKNNRAISALNKRGKDAGIDEAIVPVKRGGGGRKKTKKDADGDVVMTDADAESDPEEEDEDENEDENEA